MLNQTRAIVCRDRHYKLVSCHDLVIYELFDLEADPWEHDYALRDY